MINKDKIRYSKSFIVREKQIHKQDILKPQDLQSQRLVSNKMNGIKWGILSAWGSFWRWQKCSKPGLVVVVTQKSLNYTFNTGGFCGMQVIPQQSCLIQCKGRLCYKVFEKQGNNIWPSWILSEAALSFLDKCFRLPIYSTPEIIYRNGFIATIFILRKKEKENIPTG